MASDGPKIVDLDAHQRFREQAIRMRLPPDNRWVGGYVDLEWGRGRYIIEQYALDGKSVLEFGCNVGGSAIVAAWLGARVTALDIDPDFVELSKINAQRYGLSDRIRFLHVPDTQKLPLETVEFDLVFCNSVLEYIPREILPAVQREIDRVLKDGGIILVTGTSNRLWPKEKHTHRWFTNYVPRALDGLLWNNKPPQRGILPKDVRWGFGRYDNLDALDKGSAYFEARRKMGMSPFKQSMLRIANQVLGLGGETIGLYTPNISVALQKKR